MIKTIRTSYESYKNSVENPVDMKTYIILNNNYNKFLMEKVLDGEEITLPSRLGTVSIVGKKQKVRFDEDGNLIGLAPDWVKTKALWEKSPEAKAKRQRVFHTNDHTNGIRYKMFWSKKRVLVTNKTLYSFRATRTNKRAIHKRILSGKDYILIS